MDQLSKDYLIDFYTSRLMLHGDRPEALRWTPSGQVARYEAISQLSGSIQGKRVLDYGCGKGDLYAYWLTKDIRPMYTGLDITPELIELARLKYPECDFMVHDIEEEPLESKFALGFVCGVFNNRVEGTTESLKNSIRLLFDNVTEGLAINAISSLSRDRDIDINYVDPEDLLLYTRENITSNAQLRLDLVEGDIFLFLYK
ncbi:class I SAM-dependent methyltransferase [Nitrospirota bacterium]